MEGRPARRPSPFRAGRVTRNDGPGSDALRGSGSCRHRTAIEGTAPKALSEPSIRINTTIPHQTAKFHIWRATAVQAEARPMIDPRGRAGRQLLGRLKPPRRLVFGDLHDFLLLALKWKATHRNHSNSREATERRN